MSDRFSLHRTWNGITRLTVSPTFLMRVCRRFLGIQILGRSARKGKTEKSVRFFHGYRVSLGPRSVRGNYLGVGSKSTDALSLWWWRVEPGWREHWVPPCCGLAHGTAACLRWWDLWRSATSGQSDPRWLVTIHPLQPENTQHIKRSWVSPDVWSVCWRETTVDDSK